MAKKIWEVKTKEEHVESLKKAYERLRSLTKETQEYIAKKYYDGIMPWAETAKEYITYNMNKYELTQREAKLIGKCENDTDSVKRIGKTVKKGAARWQGCERALDEIRKHLAEEWEV